MVIIDGSYGEGGGQILRTSLTLAALTGKAVKIINIRAGRPKPGLAAQHLTGVRAVAEICGAHLEGAELGSQNLTFAPQRSPQAASYSWDVAAARKGGSAGAVSLAFQAVLLPMALAPSPSQVTLRGGTHVPWSPPYHYLERVYLPTLARLGVRAKVEIDKWGWYPMGGGEIKAQIDPANLPLSPIDLKERGPLQGLFGLSAVSNLPDHIAQRQRKRALEMLGEFRPQIEVVRGESAGQGSFLFLWAQFENCLAGFSSLGARGKPAEKVAEEAGQEYLEYYHGGAALDKHLADQLILPMALASGPSSFTTTEITPHLLTNIWVVRRFTPRRFKVEREKGQVTCYGPGREEKAYV